jgi:hypothetical protein
MRERWSTRGRVCNCRESNWMGERHSYEQRLEQGVWLCCFTPRVPLLRGLEYDEQLTAGLCLGPLAFRGWDHDPIRIASGDALRFSGSLAEARQSDCTAVPISLSIRLTVDNWRQPCVCLTVQLVDACSDMLADLPLHRVHPCSTPRAAASAGSRPATSRPNDISRAHAIDRFQAARSAYNDLQNSHHCPRAPAQLGSKDAESLLPSSWYHTTQPPNTQLRPDCQEPQVSPI